MAGKGLVSWKVCTGAFIARDRIVLTTVAATPMGVREIASSEEPYEGAELGDAVARLLGAGRLKGTVVFGIDPRRLYATTLKLDADETGKRPAELLAGRLGLAEDALVAARESVKLPGGQYAVLTACPRSVATQLVKGMGPSVLGSALLAPATWALHEAATRLKLKGKRARTELRVIPGEGSGIAMLAHNGSLVATRLFGMERAEDVNPIALAVLSLVTHAREELGLTGVESVLLHAGESGEALRAACEDAYGLPTRCAPALSTDPDACSRALAEAGMRSRGMPDQFGVLRPPPGFRKVFPVRAAALLCAVLGGAAFMLHDETARLDRETDKLQRITQKYAQKAKVNVKELTKIHGVLEAEFEIAQAFIANRVFWSEMMRELPDVVPATCTIMDLDGRDTVRYPSKKKKSIAVTSNGRQLMIAAEVPLDAADTSPPEVETFSALLKGSAWFETQFPRVTGATVRLMPAVKGLSARIMVVLYPRVSV